ncbi:MAG: leucine-rich repeat domain-containing protein [Muribaculaceae bacterium]|nr:leucine-rich repeat domain-containing protein [Muribaculaceae bacterium]
MNRKILFLISTFAFLFPCSINAQIEFEYSYEGTTLNYQVIDESSRTCAVAYYSNEIFPNIKGDVILPAYPIFQDTKYNLIEINGGAFLKCNKLTSITIPEGVTKIGGGAFVNCPRLASAHFPESLTLIGSCAFELCGITSIIIPNNVTTIEASAFITCKQLTSITLPEGITTIDVRAFGNSTNIKEIVYNSFNPVTADENIFDDEIYSAATLYIPKGTLEKYRATVPWNRFLKIEYSDYSSVNQINAETKEEIDYKFPYQLYNTTGALVGGDINSAAPGLYIIRQGSIANKIIVP